MLPGMPLPSLVSGFTTSDADVNAYFAQMTVKPSDPQKIYLDEFVKGLKTDGIWPKLSRMGFFASHDQQSATVDMRRPTLRATPSGMTFTPKRGLSRSATTSYISTGQSWYANGTMDSLVGGSFGLYQNASIPTNGVGNLVLMQQFDSANTQNEQYITLTSIGGVWSYYSRIASDSMPISGSGSYANPDASGSFLVCTDPADRSTPKTFLNGSIALSRSGDNKSFGTTTTDVRLLGIPQSESNNPASSPFYFHGAYLTDSQIASLNTRLAKLLNFYGAA